MAQTSSGSSTPEAPWPGSHQMPRWSVGELPPAPVFQVGKLWQYLGPGLLMGGAAIGGGEWLTGPQVTAKYGGGLLWLATLSILGQILYNVEISRYTLYSGEPIFTGKFRTLPGPRVWVWVYLLLDFGTAFPYLAASAAVPVAMLLKGGVVPDPARDALLIKGLSLGILLLCMLPMIFGGKIYNSLKLLMTFKIVTVMGFLLFLALFFSQASTWREIITGFFKFGNVPTGVGNEVRNVFVDLWQGRSLPTFDVRMMGLLSALVAISGQGGLSNTPISNYTRDQGWGMGSHVGAIPSLVGGQNIELSHEGTVFIPSEQSLPRWRAWVNHLVRDQLLVWGPACFFGLALPSMLSVQFLPRGTDISNKWEAPVMTSSGVARAVGESLGPSLGEIFRFFTLFCGFLVLAPSMASTIDGFVRRWVDVFWTASPRLRSLDASAIGNLYFKVLGGYACIALFMLALIPEPATLLKIAGFVYNFALGFSCWHVLKINTSLLPAPLRPNHLARWGLILTGVFFWAVGFLGAYSTLQELRNPPPKVSQVNQLTPAEEQAGWKLLFDGRTTAGWLDSREQPLPDRHVQEGSLNPHPCAYMLIHEKPVGDFELSLEFKLSPKCNSGVFIRTFPLEPRPGKDVGFNGLEVAIDDTTTAGFHDTGAIYDLVQPTRNAMRPVGEWNRLNIVCDDNRIVVKVNDQEVSQMNLDEWTEPNQRPDGTGHKFDVAYRDHPRQGYLGLQDHGQDVWYRSIKLRSLAGGD